MNECGLSTETWTAGLLALVAIVIAGGTAAYRETVINPSARSILEMVVRVFAFAGCSVGLILVAVVLAA